MTDSNRPEKQEADHSSASGLPAGIYVVATPIGNLQDLSPRALQILRTADLIAAEDTRNTGKLLHLVGITSKDMIPYHDHNERSQAAPLIQRVHDEHLAIALVSDAGTPLVSDPGYRLIAEAHRQSVSVFPVPGPSAVASFVSVAGLPSDRFTFVGFLPQKASSRTQEFQTWQRQGGSFVFFESAKRLLPSLESLATVFPDDGADTDETPAVPNVAIGRELTKKFEEIFLGSFREAVQWAASHKSLKGEIVGMVYAGESGAHSSATESLSHEEIREIAMEKLSQGSSVKDLVADFSGCGLSRKELYSLLVGLKQS